MKNSKPASKVKFSPEAHLNNFCMYLGVNSTPRSELFGARAGQTVVQQWAMYPRTLKSAENSCSSMEQALRGLPEDSKEFRIAMSMVQGMFHDVPKPLLFQDNFHRLICSLRGCLIRTPEAHLAAICSDLGIDIPTSHSEAERFGAHLLESLQQPLHAQRMVQRSSAIYSSLRALPEDSKERRMAKTMVIRATNPRRVPRSIQRIDSYRQVATTLLQAMKLG